MARTNAQHLILSNPDGEPLDHEKNQLNPRAYRDYLQSMFENINAQAPENDQGKKQVLIHIHGGLNRLNSRINRAKTLIPRVIEAEYYPSYSAGSPAYCLSTTSTCSWSDREGNGNGLRGLHPRSCWRPTWVAA